MACIAFAASAGAAHGSTDLTQMSLEQLMGLKVISASKYEQAQSEVAAAITIITRDEIRAFGWRTLGEALASLPGIHTTYDRQYANLGTRGFGLPGDYNTRVLIMLNGNRINDPAFDGGPSERTLPIDLDLIERIEFVPGPGGAVYGQNAMFGVVNLITREGADLDGFELAARHERPQRTSEGRISWGRQLDNGMQVLLSASGLYMAGEDLFFDFGEAGVSGVAEGLDSERDREFFARFGEGPWSVDLVYGKRHKSDATGAYFSDPLTPGQWEADSYALAHWQYEKSLRDDLSLLTRLWAGEQVYTSRLIYEEYPYAYPASSRWYGAEVRLVSTTLADHRLMAGIELQRNQRVRQESRDLTDPTYNTLIDAAGSRVGLYLQDEWRISDTLSATFGLRMDRERWDGSASNSEGKEILGERTATRMSPRAALIWRASDSTVVKALAGRAHRSPNAYERDYYDDLWARNPSLRGETVDTLELVVDHRVGTDLALRASLYRWSMRNLIVLSTEPETDLPQYQNTDRVNAKGLELSADKTWDSGMRLRASVSLQDIGFADGTEIQNSPHLLGKLALSAPLPWAGLRLGFEWRHDAGRNTLDGSTLSAASTANLRLATTELAEGLELALSVRNLFDKRYSHPGSDSNWQNAFEQDGRSVRLEAHYRF